MARRSVSQSKKRNTQEKQISLTVVAQEPGSQDIHIEVKRNLTAKKRRSERRFTAFILTVMLVMLFPIARSYYSYIRMNREYEQLMQRNDELSDIQKRLEEEKASLYTDEMIERLAREELDMVMPGESKVYRTIPTNDIPQREKLGSGEILH